jgi:hypothetical protein
MLYVVLALVIGAAALLVASLLTTISVYAWASVVVSVLAGLLLVTDGLLRRRRRRQLTRAADTSQEEYDQTGEAGEAEAASEDAVAAERTGFGSEPETPGVGDETTVIPAVTSPLRHGRRTGHAEAVTEALPAVPADELAEDDLDPEIEPAEEDTDAADSLLVAESSEHVVVIDERPRYHRRGCRWVGGRDVFTLPVGEVRALGFTPCALCAPDRHIAATAKRAATGRSAGH